MSNKLTIAIRKWPQNNEIKVVDNLMFLHTVLVFTHTGNNEKKLRRKGKQRREKQRQGGRRKRSGEYSRQKGKHKQGS